MKTKNYDLNIIESVNFTDREIDVLSCIVNNRSEKKIADLLDISPKTVSAHVRNIMLKLECNSKEQIIDFIEKSGQKYAVTQHYCKVLINKEFIKSLQKIAKTINRNGVSCFIELENDDAKSLEIKEFLEKFLPYSNININDNKTGFILLITSKNIKEYDNNTIILSTTTTSKNNYLDFSIEDYFIPTFELCALLLDNNISDIKQEFIKIHTGVKKYLVPENKVIIHITPYKKLLFFAIVPILCFFAYNFYYTNDKKIEVLNQYLLETNNHFSSNNVIEKFAVTNYETALKINKIVNSFRLSYLHDYFGKSNSWELVLTYLYNMNALANYYTYFEHNGDKAHDILQGALQIANLKINSQNLTPIQFDNLKPEELYSELAIIEDLPEIYTILNYSLGRCALYNDNFDLAKKYFSYSKYLGDELRLFEGYLSDVSGIGRIIWHQANQAFNQQDYNLAQKLYLQGSDLYSKLDSNKEYVINYKPRNKEQDYINPSKDIYAVVERKKFQLLFLIKLLETDINLGLSEPKQEIFQIIYNIIFNGNYALINISSLSRKKQADILNLLGNIIIKLDQLDSKLAQKIIIEFSAQLKVKPDIYEIAIKCFNQALSKSRDMYFTKADAYDGLAKVYSTILIAEPQKIKNKNNVEEIIQKYIQERDRINLNLKRKQPEPI